MAPTPRRRIKKGKITHVSLCRAGVNQMPVLLKSDRVEIQCLVKAAPEGLLHALVYVPNRVDAEGDVAEVAVVKQMAHDFLANGGHIDIDHNLKPLGPDKVQIAETFIVQKGDPRFAGWKDYEGQPVDATGAWALVLKMIDPELRDLAARGILNGVSLFGPAEVELLKSTTTKATMNEEQFQALLQKLIEALKPSVSPAQAPAVPFEGDPFNEADIEAHMAKSMLATLDFSKPSDVAKWQGYLAKRKKVEAKPAPEAEALKAELEKTKAELAKLQKSSNVPEGDKPEPKGDALLSKAERDEMEMGRKIAQALQKSGKKLV